MPDLADLTDDLKVADESPESIKARLIADTNAGIDPADPAYADTAPGGFWDDVEGAGALEWDRLYDRMNGVAAAAIPASSYGAFLDSWAESLGLERKDAALAGGTVTLTGADGTIVPVGTQVSTAQTSEDAEPVEFQTTSGGTIGVSGELDLAVVAVDAGSEGNVPANTVTIMDSSVDATPANAAAMTGGADVETDEALRKRILRKLSGAGGGGNADDYVNWALNYPGVGYVTVQPNVPTIGHVTVLITDINNDPMPSHAIDGLQAQLDPSATATQGAGQAPVGATAHVDTPSSLAIDIDASGITLEPGYSLDGAAGTRDAGTPIRESLARYVNNLPVGGDVVRNKVVAAIVDVPGVVDFDETALALNGSTSGNAVAVSATQVAHLDDVTLA